MPPPAPDPARATSSVLRWRGREEPRSISNPPLKDTGKYPAPAPCTRPRKHHFCVISGGRSGPNGWLFVGKKRDYPGQKTVLLPSEVPTPNPFARANAIHK